MFRSSPRFTSPPIGLAQPPGIAGAGRRAGLPCPAGSAALWRPACSMAGLSPTISATGRGGAGSVGSPYAGDRAAENRHRGNLQATAMAAGERERESADARQPTMRR